MGEGDAISRKPARRWVWWLTVLAGVLALLAALWLSWLGRAQRMLSAELDAIRRRGEPLRLAEMATPPVDDADNAVVLLRQAGEAWAADVEPLLEPMQARLVAAGWEVVDRRGLIDGSASAAARRRPAEPTGPSQGVTPAQAARTARIQRPQARPATSRPTPSPNAPRACLWRGARRALLAAYVSSSTISLAHTSCTGWPSSRACLTRAPTSGGASRTCARNPSNARAFFMVV